MRTLLRNPTKSRRIRSSHNLTHSIERHCSFAWEVRFIQAVRSLGSRETRACIAPHFESGPGDLTRWMAVPWQTDTASCRAGYDPEYSPFLPTFWPARVPNHVLAEADYNQVLNKKLSKEERLEAF